MKDLGLLILRLTAGGLLAWHGAQKLFGWLGGHGLQGTAQWLQGLGLRPRLVWARFVGLSEFGGGLLTALGFLHPIGPITMIAPMTMATVKAHWGKPIWVTADGAELPVLTMDVALALWLTGPGRFSLDRLLGVRTSLFLVLGALLGVVYGMLMGITSEPPSAAEEQAEQINGQQPREQMAQSVSYVE